MVRVFVTRSQRIEHKTNLHVRAEMRTGRGLTAEMCYSAKIAILHEIRLAGPRWHVYIETLWTLRLASCSGWCWTFAFGIWCWSGTIEVLAWNDGGVG